jgi:hypothetical protein
LLSIECFLQAFLRIRERCRSQKESLKIIAKQVWEVYHAPDASTFGERAQALEEWRSKTQADIYANGHWTSAERPVRAWALLPNVGP